MRRLALVVLVAGCGFRLNAVGGGSDGGVDGTHDAVIDAPPGVSDGDGDGVPDTLDNCVMVANADQRDHDSDGRGDVCDLCPHIPEGSDTDTDGDGVGDACDPRPTTAGDRRALWVGFYDQADIAGWTQSLNGGWTVSLGRLTGGDPNNSLAFIFPPAFQHTFAQTSVRVDSLANATGSVTPGAVLYTGDMGMPQYYECEVAQTNNSGNVVYIVDQLAFDQSSWPGTLAAGSEIMLTDHTVGGQHTCIAAQGTDTVNRSQAAGLTMGVVALGSTYAGVSFDYLFVVEIGT